MTGVRKRQGGELIALREHVRELGAGVAVRAPDALAAGPHNVIPFQRRAPEAHAPDVVLPADAARLRATGVTRERVRLAAFATVSLAVHGALFLAFWRDPVPLASIGLEVMTVEIMVGATAPAGIATTPGEQDVQAAAVPEPEQSKPVREVEQRATEQPQNVEVAREETAPARTMLEPQPEERQQANPKPAVAMVQSPKPEEATAKKEIPPDTTEISLLPQPEKKLAEPKDEQKPEAKPQPPKPVKNAAPAQDRRRVEAPTKDHAVKQAKASTPSTAANNMGVGRSDHDTNYAGLVSAHLRRHQQYPSEARSRGDQGSAAVTFSLDGGGRVTSAQLARGSGIASIDQEVQAMVRRASPFPAPPSGRSVSFTVPVSFRLN